MEASELLSLLLVGLVRGGLYALMGISLSLMLGVMNVCSMVNGEYFMLGGYTAYFTYSTFNLNPITAILLGTLVAGIAGALTEISLLRPLRRVAGEAWLLNTWLFTIGLSFVLKNLAQLIWKPVYRGIGSYWTGNVQLFGGFGISIDRLVAFSIAIGGIVLLTLFLQRTRLGRAIRAVNQDERGAMLAGISVNRIYTFTFALACAMGGIAGASMLSLIPAHPYMGSTPMINAWLVVILAGLGNIWGALFSALLVGLSEATAYQLFGSGWPSVVGAVMLITVLVLKPSGLFGGQVKGVWEQ
jgi:branched-chain amino acid transport system permease protein